MKQIRTIATIALVIAALPTIAKELPPAEAEEVVAKGDLLWNSPESPSFVLRYSDRVFMCELQSKVSPGAIEPDFSAAKNIPARNVEILLENPFLNAEIFDEMYGNGAAAEILGDGFRQKYVEVSCWDAER